MSLVLELSDVSKDYSGLRPLRIQHLAVNAGDLVVLAGLEPGAEGVFISLITGATLPDRGTVEVFGRATSSIADAQEWLALVDRFGIVSERVVLLEALSVVQNLAVPFTLEIEPPADDVRQRAIALALEVGLPQAVWDQPVASIDPALRLRVRLARALALDPAILLLEHPTATLPPEDVRPLAEDLQRLAGCRASAVVAVGREPLFGRWPRGRFLTVEPATGRVKTAGRFSRGLL